MSEARYANSDGRSNFTCYGGGRLKRMLMIEALANTMLVLIAISIALVGLNRILGRVMEVQFAKIAQAEAVHLDDQLRNFNEERRDF